MPQPLGGDPSPSGWFVLLDVLGLTDFWRIAALSYITSLLQPMPDGRRQFEAVLGGVARRFNVEKQVDAAFGMPNIDARKIVDILIKGLMRSYMSNNAAKPPKRAGCFLIAHLRQSRSFRRQGRSFRSPPIVRRRRCQRYDLHVDAGSVHFRYTLIAEIAKCGMSLSARALLYFSACSFRSRPGPSRNGGVAKCSSSVVVRIVLDPP